MKSPVRIIGLFVLGAVLILSGFIFFTVNEREQALVLQFGATVGGAINEPGSEEAGLHVKLPWQNVVTFDRRNLEFDGESLEIIVRNEERLLVDAFMRYQIVDPLLYYQSLGAGAGSSGFIRRQLNTRLNQILEEAMRERLSTRTISQIIDQQRDQIMEEVTSDVKTEARKLGVRIIDVRIRQADFPAVNAENVNQRMISYYDQQAELLRAQGDERAREIRAEANKEVVRLRAEAEEQSQIIRGRADAIRNCIFANAYQGVAADISFIERPTEEVTEVVDAQAEVAELAENEVRRAQDEAIDLETQMAQMLGVTCQITGAAGQGDPQRREFFSFYRSLSAYEKALAEDTATTFILSPNSEFFEYFGSDSAN